MNSSKNYLSEAQHEILDQWPKIGIICGVQMGPRKNKTGVSISLNYIPNLNI